MTTITIKAHSQCLIQSFSSIKSRFLYKLSVVKQGTFPSSYLNSGFPGWQDKTALGSLLLGSWFSLHHFLNAASPLFIRVAPVTAVRLARLSFIITPVESSLTSSLRPHRPFFLLAVLRNFPNCAVCSCFFYWYGDFSEFSPTLTVCSGACKLAFADYIWPADVVFGLACRVERINQPPTVKNWRCTYNFSSLASHKIISELVISEVWK